MIIVVSASANARECMLALEKATGARSVYSGSLRECVHKLQSQEFKAVVVDQALLDAGAGSLDTLWKHAGSSAIVTLNFAITGAERVVREVKSALRRREREQNAARNIAAERLRNELTGAVTGILLSSELALAQPELPPTVAHKLRSVHELALQMKARLSPVA